MPNFDISEILARGQQQRPQMPITGIGAALPVIGGLAMQGSQQYGDEQKKRSVMQAQQDYAQFLSMPPEDRARPENAQKGYQAALSLGINPQMMAFPRTQTPQEAEAIAAAKARGTASVPKSGTTGFSPAAIDSWVKKLTTVNPKTGQPYAVLSDIPGGMAKDSLRAQVAAKVGSIPGYDVGAGAVGRRGEISGASASARLTQGGSAQMTARTANAANQQLDILQEISDKFPRSNVQLMNTPIIKFDAQTMPEAQNWIIALNSFRNEYASALMRGNMPQGEAQREVAKSLPESITPKQLQSAIPLLRRELQALVKGQMTPATGKQGEVPSAHPQDSAAVAWAKSNPNDPRSAQILKLNGQ